MYYHYVQYYETDRMGITHHSNYIRWMEEARVAFLADNGWDYAKLEENGILSPVLSVSCQYKKPTGFSDRVGIAVFVREFNGVKLKIGYSMSLNDTSVCEGESLHCFVNREGRPIRLKKDFPDFYQMLMEHAVGEP